MGFSRMALSLNDFGKAVVAAGLVPADALKSLWDSLPADARPKDAEGFSELLVAREKLTSYQASEILAGRGPALVMGDNIILDKIGAGGMGQVFKAQHRRMKRLVAIKLLPSALTEDAAAVKRFEREVEAAARLSHPNIVTAYDAGVVRGAHYLVMEYVEGKDLSQIVKNRGPLPLAEALNYITQAARGLAYAHSEGVVHRDIKPANLLLDKKGVVKILDMGLARFEEANSALAAAEEGLTQSGQVMGTVDYMAPEQAFDTRHADARADIYSLGCSLYRLLTAENVYRGDTVMQKFLAHREKPIPSLRAKRPEVSESLDAVFQKMMAKLPEDRYQPTSQLVAELEACVVPASSTANQGISLDLSTFIPRRSSVASHATDAAGGMTAPPANQLSGNVPDSREAPRDDTYSSSSDDRTQRGRKGQNTAISGGKKPPWRNPLVLSAAAAGALLMALLGIWVIVRDKDGKPIAKVEVPDGGSVQVQEVKQSPVAKPAQKTEAAKNTPATIDLIELLDLDRDRVAVELTGANQWSKSAGKLTYSSDGRAGKLVAPIDVKNARDYEIVVDVRRLSGNDAFTLDFATSEQLWCGLDIHVPGPILLKVEGGQRQKIGDWPVAAKDGGRLVTRVRHGAENQPGSVRLSVNGQPVGQWDGVVSQIGNRLQSHPDFSGTMNVGLFCFRDSFEFSSWQLLVHDGTVRPLRAGDSAIVGAGKATTSKITNINDPAFQAWMKDVQAMPAEKQIDAVSKKLMELNPGFDGKVTDYDGTGTPNFDKGIITEIGFLTDNVTDISPVRALTGLTSLSCGPVIATVKRKLSDLSPLQGMKLNRLTCSQTLVSDLSPLQGMPLATLKCDNSKVADLSPLRGMPLTYLKCDYSQVADLSPLRGMLLTNLSCGHSRVADLSPIHGMPLEYLSFPFTSVSDLTPVAGMPLKGLGCHNTKVSDLTPLKGMTLSNISCSDTQVSDLSPLQGMNMMEVWITPQNITQGMDVIRQMKRVKFIYTKTSEKWLPAEFWQKYEAGEFGKPAAPAKLAYLDPAFQQWVKATQALPAQQQIDAVSKKLMELNPGFDGKTGGYAWQGPPKFENGVVTEFGFHLGSATDISPVRALAGLKKLRCAASNNRRGKFSDLSPLHGMPLVGLNCASTEVKDLSALAGMPLTELDCRWTPLADLSPLKGMPLRMLICGSTKVSDLTPLAAMSLEDANLADTEVADLSPLHQCQGLLKLSITKSKVTPAGVAALQKALSKCKIEWDDPAKATIPPPAARVGPQPPFAKAPFDAAQAKAHQEAWAKHLGTQVEITNGIGAKMILIPPGEFLMGSTDEQMETALKAAEEIKTDQGTKDQIQKAERPQHRVAITKPFLMGATEITMGQFKKFGVTGYQTEAEKAAEPNTHLKPGYAATDDLPVTFVTWNDAVAYCKWLSEQEKATYRLPTEAEWEYACRAGTMTQYSFGEDRALLNQYGWYDKIANGKIHPVGTKLPNGFGLFDMHGNSYEWCGDYFDEKWYSASSPNDPTGPAAGSNRVVRGGDWHYNASFCRSAFRFSQPPAARYHNTGLRIVRVLDVPKATVNPQSALANPKWLGPAFQQWIKDVAAMPAEKQIDAVSKKLMELNLGFDGKVADWNGTATPKIENNVVTEFAIVTDNVTDISPVRALSGLKKLWSYGSRPGAGQFSDLSQIRGMPLTHLSFANTQVSDMSPLVGMPLTYLTCSDTQVTDLSPSRSMKLTTLYCGNTQVADLSPLRGMPLSVLFCGNTRVADLSPLQGMPLTKFSCHHTPVSDLTPLEGAKLTEIFVTPANITRGLGVIRQMQSLKTIAIGKDGMGQHPADEFWKKYDIGELGKPVTTFKAPAFQQWMKDVQTMPADKQIEAVSKKLAELNPGFDGKVTGFDWKSMPPITDGVVTEIGFHTDNVFDLSPVRALPHLTRLRCVGSGEGKGKLSDLSPLEGMKLTDLKCGGASLLENLSALKGMPLTNLNFGVSPVSDLSPLQGMNLSSLSFGGTKVSDLSPLQGMKLTKLEFSGSPILSLSPLAGMPLVELYCDQSRVSDLSPLQGMPLTRLHCFATGVTDVAPLKGMPLTTLWAWGTKISDLAPLSECKKLTSLNVTGSSVTDASAAALQKVLPNCKIELSDPTKVTTPK
jgi:formylglycine-generating enzyme required for sulfatase activity/serine/threonine protein kinase/Leucine-rich repeat (LRR) protein